MQQGDEDANKRCEMCDGKVDVQRTLTEDGTYSFMCKSCKSEVMGAIEELSVAAKVEHTKKGNKRTSSTSESMSESSEKEADIEEEDIKEITHTYCCCFKNKSIKKKNKNSTRFHRVVVSMYTQNADPGNSDKTIHIIRNTRRLTRRSIGSSVGPSSDMNNPFASEREVIFIYIYTFKIENCSSISDKPAEK